VKGQGYSAIAGLYRQYELYYVIGGERDIVRLRTNFRREAFPELKRLSYIDYRAPGRSIVSV
jgi:hypothetical protein